MLPSIIPRLLVPLLLASAVGAGGEAPPKVAENICSEPRPEACTMEYLPVCARLYSGARRSYSNACDACADSEVEAHQPGACE